MRPTQFWNEVTIYHLGTEVAAIFAVRCLSMSCYALPHARRQAVWFTGVGSQQGPPHRTEETAKHWKVCLGRKVYSM